MFSWETKGQKKEIIDKTKQKIIINFNDDTEKRWKIFLMMEWEGYVKVALCKKENFVI